MTDRQWEVLGQVAETNAAGRWHRATCHADRPVLANLWRHKEKLDRRPFRGVEGEWCAAYEYKLRTCRRELAPSIYVPSTTRTLPGGDLR